MRRLISVVTWLPRYLIVRPIKGCLRRGVGCLFLFALLGALVVGLLWVTLRDVGAQEPGAEPLAVYLLIDNSNSMWEKGGVGSDPGLLRIDAARLFISYLGVDDSQVAHRSAVIFFGSEAELVLPMTLLTGDERRAEMFALIQNPSRMGWTDQVAALELAQADMAGNNLGSKPAVILLTDGKPEWDYDPTAAERDAYVTHLRAEGERLADAGIPLFVILLANSTTDADPEIKEVWQPVWQEMAESTAPGRFYVARQAADLTAIYHDIVVALSGNRTSGTVLQGEVGAGGLRRTIEVEPDLARLTLVASKSRPELSVTVLLPDGTPLRQNRPGVRYAGEPGVTREEIWVVDEPLPGDWTVLVSGEGQVTVWKDYRPAPPPTPTATPRPRPTATPAPTATGTPLPLLHIDGVPQAASVGQPITVAASIQNAPPPSFRVRLQAEVPGGGQSTTLLLDDGRRGDRRAGDGTFTGIFTPEAAGDYHLSVEVRQGANTVASHQMRLAVEDTPTLFLAEMPPRPRVGQRLQIQAQWQLNDKRLTAHSDFTSEQALAHVQMPNGQERTVALHAAEEGRLDGSVDLEVAGPMTITVSALGVTAGGQAVNGSSAPRTIMVREPYPYWVWGVAGTVSLAVGALVFYGRWRQQQPIVEGELHTVAGPGFGDGRTMVELDLLDRRRVIVGAPPADVVVAETRHNFSLRPGQPLGDSREMLVSGHADVLLNDRPLSEEPRRLRDADVITIGQTRLRYENLRLRSAGRAML